MVGAAIVGGSVVASTAGGIMQGNAAADAGKQAADANRQAAQSQIDMYNRTRSDLAPYRDAGATQLPVLQQYYSDSQHQLDNSWNEAQRAIPGTMTQQALEATPGYKWNLAQGLKAVQNSNAARGLGVSGNALGAAAKYATGLADSTYQNQFNNQQTQFKDALDQYNGRINHVNTIYNQLMGGAKLGEEAAAATGNAGTSAAASQGKLLQAAGEAQAAGTVGQAKGYGNALNSIGNAAGDYYAMDKYLNANNGGGFVDSGRWGD